MGLSMSIQINTPSIPQSDPIHWMTFTSQHQNSHKDRQQCNWGNSYWVHVTHLFFCCGVHGSTKRHVNKGSDWLIKYNVIIFVSITAHYNALYINEALVLSAVKRTMMHCLSVSCVVSQDRQWVLYTHCLSCDLLTTCPVTTHIILTMCRSFHGR